MTFAIICKKQRKLKIIDNSPLKNQADAQDSYGKSLKNSNTRAKYLILLKVRIHCQFWGPHFKK